MAQDQYFFIELDCLGSDDQVFSFNIYLYQPQAKNFNLDLNANSPFDEAVRKRYQDYLSKGAKLAISFGQKKTFLKCTGKKEEEIPSLKAHQKNLAEETKRKEAENKLKKEDNFSATESFKECQKENDFTHLILQARKEIMLLPKNISQTLSNAIKMAEISMLEDHVYNRIVAMTYYLAKICKIEKPEDMGDLLMASFLYDTGMTQMSSKYLEYPWYKLSAKAQEELQDHPALAIHLMRKSQIEVSERCKQIILDHHERFSGTGYPASKRDPHLLVLSQILGLVDFCFQFSEGKINGEKASLSQVISDIKNRIPVKGIQLDFNPDLIANFYALCFRGEEEVKKAA